MVSEEAKEARAAGRGLEAGEGGVGEGRAWDIIASRTAAVAVRLCRAIVARLRAGR